jgi:hypothetical protein
MKVTERFEARFDRDGKEVASEAARVITSHCLFT